MIRTINAHRAICGVALGVAFFIPGAAQATCHGAADPFATSWVASFVLAKSYARQDGTWDYAYRPAAVDQSGCFDVQTDYTFYELRLPYFDDAQISNIHVAPEYEGKLKVEIQDTPQGEASKAIVVSPINGAWVIMHAGGLYPDSAALLFTSPYAPVGVSGMTFKIGSRFQNDPSDPDLVRSESHAISVPGSALAVASVPEPSGVIMAALGMLAAFMVRGRRQGHRAA